MLAGDFETSYTAGDNSKVVPTDTIKNTVNVIAKQHLADDLERFAVILGEHFVKRHEQVAHATIEVTERTWDRLAVGWEAASARFSGGQQCAEIRTRRLPGGLLQRSRQGFAIWSS